MNDHERLLLLHKKWTGSISSEELSILEDYLSSDESFRRDAKLLETLWEKAGQAGTSFQPDSSAAWEKFRRRIQTPSTPSRISRIPTAWRIAAGVAFLVAFVAFFQLFLPLVRPAMKVVETGADAGAAYTLPDGSVVLLNAHSHLSYPLVFDDGERLVRLEGEAFFQVNADDQYPFIIKTRRGMVRVTGTEFNLRAYEEEVFEEVYVKSGTVSFQSRNDRYAVKLKPGEKARLEKQAPGIHKETDPLATPLYWINGRLNFKDTPFKDILKVLGEYFHVKFRTDKIPTLVNCHYTVNFTGLTFKETIQVIEILTKAEVKTTSDPTIFFLTGGTCR